MIALLSGTIAHKEPDMLTLDVNGVGYRVIIPFSTWFELPAEGERCTLHIHTHVTENGITLYGFRSIEEKRLFSLLITVSGIGPKMARDILSNIQPDQLSHAIASGGVNRLSSIPGIGKKTAERLVLELKEKILKLDLPRGPVGQVPSTPPTGIREDVVSALVNLGYREATVRKVIDSLQIPETDSMEVLLKAALKHLSS
ncbi:MAG: Holliday junction branch migration protein RuvA [Desulfuromonadia bacterium]